MKSQALHTVWCHISGGAGGEIWHWSLSGVKGLISSVKKNTRVPFNPLLRVITVKCQCQISNSPEILHRTVWRAWLFVAFSDERWWYYQFSLSHSYIFSLKGWENVLFELTVYRSEEGSLQMALPHHCFITITQGKSPLLVQCRAGCFQNLVMKLIILETRQ